MKKYLVVILSFVFFAGVMHAQVLSKLDSTQFLIGDQTAIHVEATFAQPVDKVAFLLNTIDAEPSIEFVEQSSIIREGNRYTRDLKVAFFDTGFQFIPAIPVVAYRGERADTMMTSLIPVHIATVRDEADDLAPIKPIIREQLNYEDFLFAIAVLALLLILGLAASYYFRKQRRLAAEERARAAMVIPKTPVEWALDELQRVEDAQYVASGEFKTHFSELSLILRQFIERTMHIPAAESTTYEIDQLLRKQHIPDNLLEDILSELRKIDLIKYAKANTTSEQAGNALDDARRYVKKIDASLSHENMEEEE